MQLALGVLCRRIIGRAVEQKQKIGIKTQRT